MSSITPEITHVTPAVVFGWFKMTIGIMLRGWYVTIPMFAMFGWVDYATTYQNSLKFLDNPLMTIASLTVFIPLFAALYAFYEQRDGGHNVTVRERLQAMFEFFTTTTSLICIGIFTAIGLILISDWVNMGMMVAIWFGSVNSAMAFQLVTSKGIGANQASDASFLLRGQIRYDFTSHFMILSVGSLLCVCGVLMPVAAAFAYVVGRELIRGGGNKKKVKSEVKSRIGDMAWDNA